MAGLAVPEVAGAAPTPTLSSLVTTHIPAGFVSTARGSGASDLPTTTDPGAQTGQVPVSPELYLRDPAKARGVDPLPTLWRLWWDPTSQQALTVSLARYPDASLATKAVATLDAALTGSTGSRGLTLTSVFVPAGLPGARGYNLSAAASATPTKSPFTVSAVLFRSGTVEYLVSMLAGGTEPATGAVSSLAVAQYHDAISTPLARPPVVAPSGTSWPWIAGAAALVVLVLLALVARRRAVVRRRRRRMHRQRRMPGSHQPAHRRSSLSRW
jgi:heme exporter protein D